MSNEEKFRAIVAETLNLRPEQVTDALTAEDIETWDSLNHINLVGALEQEFGLMLDTRNLAEVPSVARLRALLVEHGVKLAG